MELLIALALSVLFALVLRRSIKQYAIAYYIVAVAVDVLFLSRVLFDVSRDFAVITSPYIMRCLIGFGLFSVVMFIGVFPEKSKVRRMLMPIRGELSIIAAILVIGHVVNYLESYFGQILAGFVGMSLGMVLSFIVSSLLIVLLVILTVTSFSRVRKSMDPAVWKFVQKSAYVFFGLTYLHLVLVLLPTVSSTAQKAALSIAIYSAIMILYVVLRAHKAWIDRKSALPD
ncbi:MAG: hypothetical protein RR822_05845 [Raoultibacter sp.]